MNFKSNVTVIIPCYNDGDYIRQALDSILNQTLKAEKIIIIDDGSDIKTRSILKNIQIEEVEVIFQENQGVSNARNVGINLAQTDYILTLDADDYFEPTFIKKAVEVLDTNTEIGIVGCLVKILKNNKIEQEIKKPLGGKIKNFLVKNNGVSGAIFRKKCWDAVGGYDENMINGYEDWEFWIAILKNNWLMHIIQEPLFVYRKKKKSRDRTAVSKFDYELKKYIFLKHKEVYEAHFEFYAIDLLRRNSLLKNKVMRVKSSIDFRIGENILLPIRFLKNRFKKK